MRYAVSATGTFSASHSILAHPDCHRLHGHTWHVKATAWADELENGLPLGMVSLSVTLSALLLELDLRDLGHMLPTIKTTTTGLAAWIFERLAYDFPGLSLVEVWHETEAGAAAK